MKNIRIPIIVTISTAIFLATSSLASLISLSVLQPYDGIFYAFGQTQGVAGGRQQITNAVPSYSKTLPYRRYYMLTFKYQSVYTLTW
jgi:hypothetical protein